MSDSNIFTRFLTRLGVRHTNEYSTERYKMQPFNNSMYGISMLLKRYGVKNECIRFENKESVDDGDVPFLAIVKGVFVIVDEVSAKSVRVTYDSGTTERYDRKAFMEQWNGVALMATVGPESGEPDYEKHLQGWHVLQLKRVALVACLLVVAAIGIASGRSTWSIGMAVAMLLNVAGCYVSYLLMLKQLHLPSRVAERLCGLTGHDGGCDKVAASDGSTLLGVAKLSEVGAGFSASTCWRLRFCLKWRERWQLRRCACCHSRYGAYGINVSRSRRGVRCAFACRASCGFRRWRSLPAAIMRLMLGKVIRHGASLVSWPAMALPYLDLTHCFR
ncbi:MAG: hypothetical protein J6C78_07370 [Muribaculaceae bacterium]|nr:hypothetical protein [Muribaculaceae bacterium]